MREVISLNFSYTVTNVTLLPYAGEQYGLLPPQLLTKLMSGPPAKKVGNGISLGLSPTMLKFFSLTGPFIGKPCTTTNYRMCVCIFMSDVCDSWSSLKLGQGEFNPFKSAT